VGVLGSVPAILGSNNGISTIGITTDVSDAVALVGSARKWTAHEQIEEDSNSSALNISVPFGSTAEMVLQQCLELFNVSDNDVTITNAQPDEIIEQLRSGETTFGALWSPYISEFLEGGSDNNGTNGNGDGEDRSVLCTAKEAGIFLPNVIVGNNDWLTKNLNVVSKFLAGWAKAVDFLASDENKIAAIEYLKKYYEHSNITMSSDKIEDAYTTHELYNVSQQLSLLDSKVIETYEVITTFLNNNGNNIQTSANNYIVKDYLSMVNSDPALNKFIFSKSDATSNSNISNSSVCADFDQLLGIENTCTTTSNGCTDCHDQNFGSDCQGNRQEHCAEIKCCPQCENEIRAMFVCEHGIKCGEDLGSCATEKPTINAVSSSHAIWLLPFSAATATAAAAVTIAFVTSVCM